MSEPPQEPSRDPRDPPAAARAAEPGATSDDDFLAALADEFALRARRGERPTVEEYVAKHPTLAENIRRIFPAIAAIEESRSTVSAIGDGPGSIIGRYKLLERIGEGGFGVVYMAEQQLPVRRKVALKVLKPGMDSRQVLARFEAERQALALMDHENIAKVLDAGATESGRPYFVMELVHGVPITEYCDRNRLPPRQRLELFVLICRAVQHAHTKGIIHRDIKPTNVMVTLHEGVAVPKVIDFGVAKATGQQLTDKTLFTNFQQMVGTPLYMSPEQAEMTSIDVDTRSDVYSLGVLLYELLTGTTPVDKERMKQAAFDEVRRIIREEEPPKPSTRLSTTEALPSIAANRGLEPKKLSGLMRGELDWIVMKALEKQRHRRYETANAFAADVQRYLADEPVLACEPSAVYRLKKFVQRNKGAVLAAAVVLLTMLGGIIGTSIGLMRAERRLAQLETANEVLASVFKDLDPKAGEKEGVTLRVLLGRRLGDAVLQLNGDAVGDPLVVAKLQHLLGVSLRELGHLEQAEAALTSASQTRERLLGTNHLETATSRHNLAQLYRAQGKYDQAAAVYNEVIQVRTATLGPVHVDTLATKNNLALVYMSLGKHAEAEPLLLEVLAVRAERLGADDPSTLQSKHNLAGLYENQGKVDQAVVLLKEVLAGRTAKLRPGHPDTLQTKNNLGGLYLDQGRHAEAEALLREVLETSTSELGPSHAFTLNSKTNLAVIHQKQGNDARAEVLFKEVLQAQLANPALGPRHPDTIKSRWNLARIYQHAKKYDQSIPVFEEAIQVSKVVLGPDDPQTLLLQGHLANSYRQTGRMAEALTLIEELQAKADKYPDPARLGRLLIDTYMRARKMTEADTLSAQQMKAAREKFPGSTQLADAMAFRGQVLLRVKSYSEAEVLLRETLSLREKLDPAAWTTPDAKSMLGGALLGQQRFADAEPLLLDGYRGLKQIEAQIPEEDRDIALPDALDRLIQLYDAWGKPDEAAKWRGERRP
jgi:serine/threonine protein kinase/Tfp pilus assembly protein PilF